MAIIKVKKYEDIACVYFPFSWERVEMIKSLDVDKRAWDQDQKCWYVEHDALDELRAVFSDNGDKVHVTTMDGKAASKSGTKGQAKLEQQVEGLQQEVDRLSKENRKLRFEARGEGPNSSQDKENQRLRQEVQRLREEARRGTWADELLRGLTDGSIDRAYKKISTTVHPDVGGTDKLMKELNAAYERRRSN